MPTPECLCYAGFLGHPYAVVRRYNGELVIAAECGNLASAHRTLREYLDGQLWESISRTRPRKWQQVEVVAT